MNRRAPLRPHLLGLGLFVEGRQLGQPQVQSQRQLLNGRLVVRHCRTPLLQCRRGRHGGCVRRRTVAMAVQVLAGHSYGAGASGGGLGDAG